MLKQNGKIIIFRNLDKELFRLIERIEITKFGSLKFDDTPVKEIRIKGGKPYQIITIEKSTLLSENHE